MQTNQVIGMVFTLLLVAALVVGISAVKSSQYTETATCNETSGGVDLTGCNAAYNLTKNTEGLSNNLSSQLPTVGTMIGIGLMIGAIAFLGVWGYGKVRGM